MPGMDGFEVCMAVRQDPLLAHIPIVLVSAHYADAADDELARRVGASALLPRKADFQEIMAAIAEILDRGVTRPSPTAPERAEDLHRDHVSRARLQLERQLALNAGQAQRAALQSAQLSILSGVANALTGCVDVDAQLGDVLASCLDAAGITRGVLYRTSATDGVRVSHAVGFGEADRAGLEQVFGHPGLLARAVALSAALPVAAPPLDPDEAASFLARAGLVSAFFVPLVGGGLRLGALLLGSSSPTPEHLQLDFCRAMAAYIGQALALAEAFAREQAARQAAEEASRAKTTFLSLVSHELLTPLTSIRLQIDRLERSGDGLGDRQRQMVGQAGARRGPAARPGRHPAGVHPHRIGAPGGEARAARRRHPAARGGRGSAAPGPEEGRAPADPGLDHRAAGPLPDRSPAAAAHRLEPGRQRHQVHRRRAGGRGAGDRTGPCSA